MAALGCNVIYANAEDLTPPSLFRWEPGDTDSYQHDFSEWIDCAGDGVTLLSATTTIEPDYDDGEASVGTQTIAGLVATIYFAATSTQTQRDYLVKTVATFSDSRTIIRYAHILITPTRRPTL